MVWGGQRVHDHDHDDRRRSIRQQHVGDHGYLIFQGRILNSEKSTHACNRIFLKVNVSELPSWACDISWVDQPLNQRLQNRVITHIITRWRHWTEQMMQVGAIFLTTKYTVSANVITTQSSFWRHQALISGPCDQHFSDSHQNPLKFTPKAWFFCGKIEDQSNSVRFWNISVWPEDLCWKWGRQRCQLLRFYRKFSDFCIPLPILR